MPIDINLLREQRGGNPEVVRESERKRFNEEGNALIDNIIALDAKRLELVAKVDTTRGDKNALNKQVGIKKRAKEECDDLVAQSKQLGEDIAQMEKELEEINAQIAKDLPRIGNIVHKSVPVSNDEDKDNEIVNTWGEFPTGEKYESHHQLLWKINGYEPERGVVVSGHRGYFLKGNGVMLNQALINYALQFLTKKGYTPLQPPYFMNKDVMSGVAQLEDFDEELYHVKVNGGTEDKYLIATSEQPICAYHKNDWIQEKELPIKYAGMSTCFRKEAGKHGKDTWGIFRVHQFDKIEQFCITTPEKSWEMHEEMREIAEEYLQSLKLPYRVVNIVSGELNNAAAKKYDIEAWFPGYGEFKELVSCSNCLDYQSRAMETRCGQKKGGEKEKKYCHFLNSTLCALTRTICCILENYQTEDGVNVPEVLVPYMGGVTFLPFVRDEKVNVSAKKMLAASNRQKSQAKNKKKATAITEEDKKTAQAAVEAVGGDVDKAIEQQGEKVRALKAEKAEKAAITSEVNVLVALKSLKL